jgi:hypothetical protein
VDPGASLPLTRAPRPFVLRQCPTALEHSIGSDISAYQRWIRDRVARVARPRACRRRAVFADLVERSCRLGLTTTTALPPVLRRKSPRILPRCRGPTRNACVREGRCLVRRGCTASPRDETRTPSAGDLDPPHFRHQIVTMKRRSAPGQIDGMLCIVKRTTDLDHDLA